MEIDPQWEIADELIAMMTPDLMDAAHRLAKLRPEQLQAVMQTVAAFEHTNDGESTDKN